MGYIVEAPFVSKFLTKLPSGRAYRYGALTDGSGLLNMDVWDEDLAGMPPPTPEEIERALPHAQSDAILQGSALYREKRQFDRATDEEKIDILLEKT